MVGFKTWVCEKKEAGPIIDGFVARVRDDAEMREDIPTKAELLRHLNERGASALMLKAADDLWDEYAREALRRRGNPWWR